MVQIKCGNQALWVVAENMDEQAEEIDILQSIYPEEIKIYTPTLYAISLVLDTLPPQGLTMDVEYPATYPQEDIFAFKLSSFEVPPSDDPAQEAPYPYDFTSDDLDELTQQAREWAQENIGMASVFTVLSQLKDAAEELHASRVSAKEAEHLKQLAIEEEKEQQKFRGTKVTKESFNEWNRKFRKEMGWDQPKNQDVLTGRQIFERGLARDADDTTGEDETN